MYVAAQLAEEHVRATLSERDSIVYHDNDFEPFRARSAVALSPAVGDVWSMNASRVPWRHELLDGGYRRIEGSEEDDRVWSPQHRVDVHRPDRWGFLEFGGR